MLTSANLKAKTAEQKSFAAHVSNTLSQAIDHIIFEARKANSLAKISHGVSRRQLYNVKHQLISRALELDTSAFLVDSFDPAQGIVGLSGINGIRLHAPTHALSPAAQDLIMTQINKY